MGGLHRKEGGALSTVTVQVPRKFAGLYKPHRYKALKGGRGSAKSHTIASALLTQGLERPLRILCCREIQRSIRDSVKRLLDDKIQEHGYQDYYQSTDAEIRGPKDTLFLFAGLRSHVDAIKSMEAIDIAWVEEAQTVAQRSLDILVPTIRNDGSEIWFSWNPRYETDPVDSMFGKHQPPDTFLEHVTYRDNPWFPEVLRKELEWDRQRDPIKYSHVWEGEYLRNSEAQVFRNWRIGSEDEFKTDLNTRFYFGGDWGFSVDPTALVRCYINGRALYVDYEAYQVGCEIDRTPELFKKVPGSQQWPILADSARPETISYMQKHGFPKMRAAVKGSGSVEDGVEFLRSYDIVVHPRCRHTIDELTFYQYKVDKVTGEVLPILEDKKNHCIDALRYATEPTRRARVWRIV